MTLPALETGKRAAYPAYKPSDLEWVGDVPEHWEVRRLKYATTINDEVLPETTDPDYEFIYVDIGSVDASKGIAATERYRFEDAPSRARRIVRHGDTIVSTVRTYLRAIASIRESAENLIVSTGFAVVRPRTLDPSYLSYALRSPSFVETVVSRSTGVSYPAINAAEIGNIGVISPPLDEQRAIAVFLDRETARIDALIEKKQRQIELLQEKRSALISHTVTKGLNPNAPMKDSGVEWLGDVPTHWEVTRLKHHVELLPGFAFSSTGFSYEPEDIRLLRGVNVTPGRIDWGDAVRWDATDADNYDQYELKVGDIVFGMDRPWISSGIRVAQVTANDVPSLLLQRVARLRARPTLLQGYLVAILQSRAFYNYFAPILTGVSVPHISPDQILNFTFPRPTVQEQRVIVDRIDQQAANIKGLVATVEYSITMLREHRTALISAAVTGKIDVREEVAG